MARVVTLRNTVPIRSVPYKQVVGFPLKYTLSGRFHSDLHLRVFMYGNLHWESKIEMPCAETNWRFTSAFQ